MVVVRGHRGAGPEFTKGVLIAPQVNPTRYDLPKPVSLGTWTDPVSECLKTTSVLNPEVPLGGGLDGIGYTLYVDKPSLQAEIRFSNPTAPEAVRLESSFLSAAATIAGLQKDEASASFLPIWRKYAKH
jgi:hypothetical protein